MKKRRVNIPKDREIVQIVPKNEELGYFIVDQTYIPGALAKMVTVKDPKRNGKLRLAVDTIRNSTSIIQRAALSHCQTYEQEAILEIDNNNTDPDIVLNTYLGHCHGLGVVKK